MPSIQEVWVRIGRMAGAMMNLTIIEAHLLFPGPWSLVPVLWSLFPATPLFDAGDFPPAPPHEEKPAQAPRVSPRGSSSRALLRANMSSRTAPATRPVGINGTLPAAQIYAQGHGTCRPLFMLSVTTGGDFVAAR